MDARKLQFSQSVTERVRHLCEVVFNIHSTAEMEKLFGISHEQMKKVIEKIINALPDHLFERLYPAALEEIKNICAREFLFFQVQEKSDDAHYQEDLSNFIYIFRRDIQQKINAYQTAAKMREE